MFVCPRCNERLIRRRSKQGILFVCAGCQGRAVGLSVVRRMAGRKPVRDLWNEANSDRASEGVACPICRRVTAAVRVAVDERRADLDVCTGCQFVWFDPKELERLPEAPPPSEEEKPLPEEAREKLAVAEAQSVGERAEAEDRPYLGPADTWKWIPGVLGMPVECQVAPVRGWAWITWGLAAVLVAVFALTSDNLREIVEQFGLKPAEWDRNGGLTLLSSFFLHGTLFHLIANTYFLLVFGDNVEDYLGRFRYVTLLLFATLAGSAAHVLGDPQSTTECIGASGGISGVITFYALRFPEARLGILLRYWLLFRWLYMPAYVALIFWFLIQFLTVFLQLSGATNVSALAHLGGAAVGVAAWLAWRRK